MALKGEFGGEKQDLPFSDERGITHMDLGFWASKEGEGHASAQQLSQPQQQGDQNLSQQQQQGSDHNVEPNKPSPVNKGVKQKQSNHGGDFDFYDSTPIGGVSSNLKLDM